MVQPTWKTVWQFLKMLYLQLPYDPAIPLLGRYPRKMKACVLTHTWTQMFIVALVMKAPKWTQTYISFLLLL